MVLSPVWHVAKAWPIRKVPKDITWPGIWTTNLSGALFANRPSKMRWVLILIKESFMTSLNNSSYPEQRAKTIISQPLQVPTIPTIWSHWQKNLEKFDHRTFTDVCYATKCFLIWTTDEDITLWCMKRTKMIGFSSVNSAIKAFLKRTKWKDCIYIGL